MQSNNNRAQGSTDELDDQAAGEMPGAIGGERTFRMQGRLFMSRLQQWRQPGDSLASSSVQQYQSQQSAAKLDSDNSHNHLSAVATSDREVTIHDDAVASRLYRSDTENSSKDDGVDVKRNTRELVASVPFSSTPLDPLTRHLASSNDNHNENHHRQSNNHGSSSSSILQYYYQQQQHQQSPGVAKLPVVNLSRQLPEPQATIGNTGIQFDRNFSTFGLQPEMVDDIELESSVPAEQQTIAFTPIHLPKHLRQPSLPPPTGPLPRTPSRLENEQIGARLSASSPTGVGRTKLNAYPFPIIQEVTPPLSQSPESAGDIGSTAQHSGITAALAKLENSQTAPPSYSALAPSDSTGLAANHASPDSLALPSTDSPILLGRQLSAITQASSDALGEASRPSVQYDPSTLPRMDKNPRQSIAKTDDSGYTFLTMSSTTSDDKSLSFDPFGAPLSLGIPQWSRLAQQRNEPLPTRSIRIDDNTSSGSDAHGDGKSSSQRSSGRGSLYAKALSDEEIKRDLRSLSRLSGLSLVSGGAAFFISEENLGTERSSGISYRVENITPENANLARALSPENLEKANDKLSNSPQYDAITSKANVKTADRSIDLRNNNVKVHPADERFEHTYRMRRASDAEEAVYVPVYSFEPPGKFPDRNRLTAPKQTPGLVNYTPRNFSMPARVARKATQRSSSDSSEMLLGEESHFDGESTEITQPPAAYGQNLRSAASVRLSRAGKPHIISTSPTNDISDATAPWDRRPSSRLRQSPKTLRFAENVLKTQRSQNQPNRDFQDLDRLEKAFPNIALPRDIDVRGPRHVSSKHGTPTLYRATEAYVGSNIDKARWPERYKRQARIGRSLLLVCLIMPPLWLVMAVGLLDNLVSEMTGGEIWTVGRREKIIAAWLGGTFCFCLIVAIITVGIVVL